MTFKESVIIPLTLYQRCVLPQIDTGSGIEKTYNLILPKLIRTEDDTKINFENTEAENILYQKHLPTDVKMKLWNQEKFLKRKLKKRMNALSEEDSKQKDLEKILFNIPEKDRPNAEYILKTILRNPGQIFWNDNLEIVIGGHHLPGSNIISLLNYFFKNTVVTSERDKPLYTDEFKNSILRDLNITRAILEPNGKSSAPRLRPKTVVAKKSPGKIVGSGKKRKVIDDDEEDEFATKWDTYK